MTTRRALVAFVTLVTSGWALNACARSPDSTLDKWKAGTNYQLAPAPQPTNVGAGKVEVNEVFWYGCGHCYALDPALESWKTSKASYVEFVRIPVIWGEVHRQHAKLFYTLQALNRPELHVKVFDAIHKFGMALSARDEVEARAVHFGFLSGEGVSAAEFNAAYDSMSVATNVTRAAEFTRVFQVGSVPLMVVNRKFITSVSEAGGEAKLISLVNDLAASEKNR